VARIPAGGSFTSDPITLTIPANAPEKLTLRVRIDKLYYHQGRPDQTVMAGLYLNRAVTIADTAYYGDITSISPAAAMAGETVTISGRALGWMGAQVIIFFPIFSYRNEL